MTTQLRPVWELRGMFGEARRWLDLALDASEAGPTPLRVHGLQCAARTAVTQGDLPAARARIAEGRTLLAAIDDPELRAAIDFADGQIAMNTGDLERARDCFQRAIDNTDDYETQTSSMYLIGMMLEFLGAHDEAMAWQEKALALAECRSDPYEQAIAQSCLGLSLFRRGELQRAEEMLREALQSFSRLKESWISLYCLEPLAWIAGSHGDARRAVVLMAAASALSRAAGIGLFPMAEMPRWHDECERHAREELGAAEFATVWAHGEALTLDEVADFALQEAVDRCASDTLVRRSGVGDAVMDDDPAAMQGDVGG